MTFTPTTRIPSYASGPDYPERAKTVAQMRLPFYCCNCSLKRETKYLTPNLGPFCEECWKEFPSFVIVNAEEWAGLYVNGTLIEENHLISEHVLVRTLKGNGVDIKQETLTEAAVVEMCENGSGLPSQLADVKLVTRRW